MATIKLTNGVEVDSSSLKMFIDPTNVLYSHEWTGDKYTVNEASYTATEDCVIFTVGYEIKANRTTLNNVYLFGTDGNSGSGRDLQGSFYVRAGDTFKFSSHVTCYCKAYGLK